MLILFFWLARPDQVTLSPYGKPSGCRCPQRALKCDLCFYLNLGLFGFFVAELELWFEFSAPPSFVMVPWVFQGQLSLHKLLDTREPGRGRVGRAKAKRGASCRSQACNAPRPARDAPVPLLRQGGERALSRRRWDLGRNRARTPSQETCPCSQDRSF